MGQLLVVTNGYERLPFSLNVNHICMGTIFNFITVETVLRNIYAMVY